MTPERWQRIEQLYHDSLEQAAPQRAEWLSAACADDEALRGQVEVLLAANDEADSFLAVPALAREAQAMSNALPTHSAAHTGERFAHYRVLSKLGAGGMGEVYLAYDEKLERQVALKVLPEEFTQSHDRLQRFVREGKAASALNHPNIITIHEIGAEPRPAGATHFIVTEYIAGETLRQRLRHGKLPPAVALDFTRQIASALAAAHAAGIVHRDIKPENVMVRPDGLVKVLDFGLAKLTEKHKPAAAVDAEADTMMRLSTSPGVVMGTMLYMSPEQARGQSVDARSDLFSLGALLYELLTGRAPFAAATMSDVLVGILDRDPAPLAQADLAAPEALQSLVSKALRKDREQRYQSAQDLLNDLKPLHLRLESAAQQLEEMPTALGLKPLVTDSAGRAAATALHDAASANNSAAVILTELKRHKRGLAMTLTVAALVLAGLFFGMYRWLTTRDAAGAPLPVLKLDALTLHGKALAAAISPDGKFVVYAKDEGGRQSLYWRRPKDTSERQIISPQEVEYRYLVFAGADDSLYYTVKEAHSADTTLYRATTLGDEPKRLLTGVESAVGFAPGGSQMAFVRHDRKRAEWTLVIADADGKNERPLATRQRPEYFNTNLGEGGGGVAWSPDGQIIACTAGNSADPRFETVFAYDAKTGRAQPLTAQHWTQVAFLAWQPDGQGLIAIAQLLNGRYQLWRITYPSGVARQIREDLYRYDSLSLSADGRAVAVVNDRPAALWTAQAGRPESAARVNGNTGKDDGYWGLTWRGEEQLLYVVRNANATATIWQMNLDGSRQQQLYTANWIDGLSLSDAGRQLVFMQRSEGTAWRISLIDLLTNGDPRELVSGGNAYRPRFEPNGQWVVYVAASDNKRSLWKAPTTGGAPTLLNHRLSNWPVVSPDGMQIAYHDYEQAPPRLAVMAASGGEPTKLFAYPDAIDGRTADIRWTPDGRALTYIITRNGVSNLWNQPLDGSPPKQITQFKAERIYRFDWSRAGKLALARGADQNDVMLIDGLK